MKAVCLAFQHLGLLTPSLHWSDLILLQKEVNYSQWGNLFLSQGLEHTHTHTHTHTNTHSLRLQVIPKCKKCCTFYQKLHIRWFLWTLHTGSGTMAPSHWYSGIIVVSPFSIYLLVQFFSKKVTKHKQNPSDLKFLQVQMWFQTWASKEHTKKWRAN